MDGTLPFIDLMMSKKDNTFAFNIYRKPTHTNILNN